MTASILPGNIPLGRRIDQRYRVDGYLGGGQNGHVYDVWDTNQNQRAALKMLDPNRLDLGRWAEAQKLTSLSGRYIMPILNARDEAGVPYIVTEVMLNGTVEDAITPGIGAPVDQAAEWVRQAAIGIARVHDHRLVHVDIKAGNLFRDADNNVLVGDFGLAGQMDAAGNAHGGGSPETMAPEVPTTATTNARTDVYSLGATLYHLLAGDWMNPALRTLTTWTDLKAAVSTHGTPTPIGDVAPHVPQGLRSIVMKAIDPIAANRYASASELATVLGGRTRPRRTWLRDHPCPGHTMCFTGSRAGNATIKVCAVPSGARGTHTIQSIRTPAGTRLNPWPTATKAQLATRLRARLAALT